jgi:hypothetical protein
MMGVQKSVVLKVVNGGTKVVPARVRISISDQDEVIWSTEEDMPFTVVFKENQSPFKDDIFVGDKSHPVRSGKASRQKVKKAKTRKRKRGSEGKDHEYTALVGGARVLDPVVHTDP